MSTDSVFVVIDVGCHECGVESEPVGMYQSKDEAYVSQFKREEETNGWRDGGQTKALVFEMELPA